MYSEKSVTIQNFGLITFDKVLKMLKVWQLIKHKLKVWSKHVESKLKYLKYIWKANVALTLRIKNEKIFKNEKNNQSCLNKFFK